MDISLRINLCDLDSISTEAGGESFDLPIGDGIERRISTAVTVCASECNGGNMELNKAKVLIRLVCLAGARDALEMGIEDTIAEATNLGMDESKLRSVSD